MSTRCGRDRFGGGYTRIVEERHYNIFQWWHMLSLDAPTVAVVWSWSFTRAMRLRAPFSSSLLLGLLTWLIYVADRILDGLGRTQSGLLRERHLFHARHRRRFLLATALFAALALWMVLTRMVPRALHEDLFLSFFVLLYFSSVHIVGNSARPSRPRWLPKELAVGILFATATAVPAWSRLNSLSGAARGRLVEAVLLFALLCWVNCVAIEKWERGARLGRYREACAAHVTTCWAARRLREIALLLVLVSISAAWLSPSRGLAAVYLAAALSSGCLLALDQRRLHLSPSALRIAADAALLSPLAFLPILR